MRPRCDVCSEYRDDGNGHGLGVCACDVLGCGRKATHGQTCWAHSPANAQGLAEGQATRRSREAEKREARQARAELLGSARRLWEALETGLVELRAGAGEEVVREFVAAGDRDLGARQK